jgi:hypothetical protein
MLNFTPILVAILLLIGKFIHINGERCMGTHLLTLRNQYLRLYICNKRSNIKTYLSDVSIKIKDKTNVIYNKIISKYHDAHIAYYSLQEYNIELIEQLIGLNL